MDPESESQGCVVFIIAMVIALSLGAFYGIEFLIK